jgi:hypothetical protein
VSDSFANNNSGKDLHTRGVVHLELASSVASMNDYGHNDDENIQNHSSSRFSPSKLVRGRDRWCCHHLFLRIRRVAASRHHLLLHIGQVAPQTIIADESLPHEQCKLVLRPSPLIANES